MELQLFSQFDNLNVSDKAFMIKVIQITMKHQQYSGPYFVGLCYSCTGLPAPSLHRCGGCQLVAYCSRHCQKNDWSNHKYVCKEFPVVKGKNVLHTTKPWKNHLISLREQAAQVPNADLSIFSNPRVCHTCREARPDLLMDCECYCVSYCSKRCAKADKQHKKHCSDLNHIAGAYIVSEETGVTMMAHDKVCDKFSPVTKWSDIMSTVDCHSTDHIGCVKYLSCNERASYAMTLLYALQQLPGTPLGPDQSSLEDLTSLTVHVVTSSPLFHADPWEIILHRLPNLKELNVVFLMQGKGYKDSFNMNNGLSLKRCEDCLTKNRVITYSVQQMLYHMFFSLPEFSEPDVVVVYGNTQEMSTGSRMEPDVTCHSQISYSNMTYSRDTVLVLTDVTKDLVNQGVRAVNAARPVHQLVGSQFNPLGGFSSDRANLDSNTAIINDRSYFTCLKRK